MSGTEDNNPATRDIDQMDTLDVVRCIHEADRDAYSAIDDALDDVTKAVEVALDRIEKGGRVIYVGAGTSGRLAVQDVAELRPTYGIDETMFDYIIAGGSEAILKSVEGAEDSRSKPIEMLKAKDLGRHDVVFGITASGTTPFVLAALDYASTVGAYSIGLTNNRNRPIEEVTNMTIVLDSGPEVIQGSTRMKAGTAQKMVLGMFSTAIAIKLGFTYKNTMSRMGAWFNEKLRKRAIRMVSTEFGLDMDAARKILEDHYYRISEVVSLLERKKNGQDKEKKEGVGTS